ncbi:hypothetical protein ACP4OV_027940 [Aristida adscensionis]
MAFSLLPELLISTLALLAARLYIKYWRSRNPWRPLDWPVLGVLPSLAGRLQNFNDQIADVLAAHGGNLKAEGPAATGLRFFVTADPANVRHIFTAKHGNYPKGEEFAEIFDVVAGSIFTADGEPGRRHRAMFQSVLTHPRVLDLMAAACRDKVMSGVLPFMARAASAGAAFDVQDLVTRLVFDLTAAPIFGVDPGRLPAAAAGGGVPSMRVAGAMDTVMEVGLLRHIIPASCWKAMRRLKIGPERRLAAAHAELHAFVKDMMEERRARRGGGAAAADEVVAVDILCADPQYGDEFLLRKTLINYMIAGRDTVGTALPWVFYNLAMNPRAVAAIRRELAPVASRRAGAGAAVPDDAGAADSMLFFEPEETKDLVYLHAALFESLRLHPPGPFERKVALADDVLPSGHPVRAGETVLISIYAMGRMESVWGKDCYDYRPERWLSDDGGGGGGGKKLRYVPSHKFTAFNSGPRMCLGKDIAVTQMKAVVAAVLWNFDVEMVEGQRVEPKLSCILQMKNGLMVTVNKRKEGCNVV